MVPHQEVDAFSVIFSDSLVQTLNEVLVWLPARHAPYNLDTIGAMIVTVGHDENAVFLYIFDPTQPLSYQRVKAFETAHQLGESRIHFTAKPQAGDKQTLHQIQANHTMGLPWDTDLV